MLTPMGEQTGDLLFGTARRMRREFGAALLDAEVTPAQARALRTVMEAGAMRPSALAERLHIAARSATELVDALEERALVAREPDPDDRRATLVRPTQAARAALAEVDRVRQEQAERFLAVLSERDRRSLDRILRLLLEQPVPEGLEHPHSHHHRHGGRAR
jgi:DNA-binding MarR family transcriptional regulator